ncbi:MAG: heat-inducible transcriptional repressor HrcA [Oscillospiraceae bacterium]|nr:heat-inducible transcriptional repressor HrcA [Oscillospiraceae bacterium]
MSLSERKKEILRAVVELYVKGAEPVGSRAVVEKLESSVSSATIRSEMADLESMGLLEQPHTSAGRIPSSNGYRIYVNELMQNQHISGDDAKVIDSELDGHLATPTNLLDKVGKLTSRLTTYPAYAMASATGIVCIARFDLIYVDYSTFIIVTLLSNDTVKNKLVHLTTSVEPPMLTKLSAVLNASFTGIPEERITPALIAATERAVGDTAGIVAIIAGFTIELLVEAKTVGTHISGAVNLLSHPEFKDVDKAQRIIRYLTDEKELAKLPSPNSPGELKITIGPENLANELRDSSVMAIKYDAGNDIQGLIGVVGPTRMDYSKVAAHLSYMAQGLSWLLGGLNSDLLQLNPSTKNTLGDEHFGEE